MRPEPRRGRRRRIPILRGVLPVEPSQVPAEIVAGLTLAALAIPEVLGYTKISGTPLVTGLHTILIPMAVFAIFGASRHLVVGADSATAAILAAGLAGLATTGSAEYVALASALALMAAGFLFIARAVGLAFMADFLSRSVLVGFLTGVGLQVALGEVPGMLGLPHEGHGAMASIRNSVAQIGQTNPWALGVSLVALAVVLGGRKFSRKIPGALVAVVGAIAASRAFGLESHMNVVGTVPSGLPHIGLPRVAWSMALLAKLVPTAFAMFVVILAQSAATSRAYASKYDERLDERTDLLGLALANVGAGLSGTFVVNGSPTKTQMVDSLGGRTQLSLIVTSCVVLLVLLFLTGPLAYMPECVLSAVVFLIGMELMDIAGMRRIYVLRRAEFWVALATALMVVLVGVEQGILLAIVLSLIEHTRRGYRPRNAVLVRDESGAWHPLPLATGSQAEPGLIIYRFSHSMYYANSQQLAEEVSQLTETADPPLRWFCIAASAVDDVDFTAAETLNSVLKKLEQKGIRMVVAQVQDETAAKRRFGTEGWASQVSSYATLEDVTTAYRREGGAVPGGLQQEPQ